MVSFSGDAQSYISNLAGRRGTPHWVFRRAEARLKSDGIASTPLGGPYALEDRT